MPVNMKKVLIIITLIIGARQYAQELPEIIARTPEAATLGKYGNTPVSKYTGVPQISIPLYTIVEGDIEVPITLSYHAGGFRVQEDATWVGLGWSLSSGGMISRDPRGDADKLINSDAFSEWGQNNILPEEFVSSSTNSSFNIYGISRVFRNTDHKSFSDIEPYFLDPAVNPAIYTYVNFQADHFNYTFPRGSGEFYNKDNVNFIDKTKNLLKIDKGASSDNASFKITDTNGTIYKYGNPSLGVSIGGIERSANLAFTLVGPSSSSMDMNWHMTNITSRNGDEVNFFYENTGPDDLAYSAVSIKQSKFYFPGEISNSNGNDLRGDRSVESQSRTQKSVLSKIEFTDGFMLFIVNDASNPREDVRGSGAKKLEAIEVYRYTGSSGDSALVKRVEFEYSYFAPGYNYGNLLLYTPSEYHSFDYDSNEKRLRLDKIKEYGTDLNVVPKTHEFEYNNTQLPPKTSYSVDKYGYYNGKRNFTFIPEQIINGIPYSGADVEPNPDVIEACLLQKIIYPTKGNTIFEYEPNEYQVAYVDKEIVFKAGSEYSGGNENSSYHNPSSTFILEEEKIVLVDVTLLSRNSSVNSTDLYIRLSRNEGGYARSWYFIGDSSAGEAYCVIQTEGENGPPLPEQNCSKAQYITLPPGTYTIETHNDIDNIAVPTGDGDVLSIATATVSYTYRDDDDRSEYGPGVRIRQIIDKNYDGSTIGHRLFDYTKVDGGSAIIPSGVLLYKPEFNYWVHEVEEDYDPGVPGSPSSYISLIKHYRTNTSRKSFSTSANGKMLGYSRVTETKIDRLGKPNGKILSEYYNYIDDSGLEGDSHGQQNFPSLISPLNGLLQNEKIFKSNGNDFEILRSTNYDYKVNESDVAWYGIPYPFNLTQRGNNGGSGRHYHPLGNFIFPTCLYPEISSFVALNDTTEKVFDTGDENDPIAKTTNYLYDNTQLSSESTRLSNNKVQTTHYYYPLSNSYEPIAPSKPSWVVFPQQMIDKNMVGSPVVTTTAIDGTITAITATDYKIWHQNTVTTVEDDIVMPEKVKTIKGDKPIEERIIYHNYDDKGNALEVSKENGPIISYIWGYNKKYPIAKIENADYEKIANALGISLTDLNNFDENNLSQLNSLRNNSSMSDAMVNTFIFNPLIGVTSTTDSRGYIITYEYDDFNRLKMVKDQQGNIVSDYKYHYKE